MRTAASLCWNFSLFLWTLLNFSVRKTCFTYEIQLPRDYAALTGDLEVVVVDLIRTASENVRLELLELQYVHSRNKEPEKREANVTNPLLVTSPHHHGPLIKFVDTRNVTNSSIDEWDGPMETREYFPKPLPRIVESGESEIPQIKVDKRWTLISSVSVPVNGSDGGRIVSVRFPCGVIIRGGRFGVKLTGHNPEINNLTVRHRGYKFYKLESDLKMEEVRSDISIVGLDVRWPPLALSISPRHIETYPDITVTASFESLPTKCAPGRNAPSPEMWLDLVFCGHSLVGCAEGNATHRQVVYSEQIRGYPKKRTILLGCELFGSAGHFVLMLRPSVQTGSFIQTDSKDAHLKVVWSEHYIFNVHARSIFPCDVHGGGIPVLFQYPRCILKGDRVRLFSRLRADVSSLVSPTSLHYVTEQRVVKGKHSLYFDCDFFSEKFIEYCFVYVSQAITGAVSDVRMDCVPTMPVYDSDSGNWGAWNAWSSCTSTCGGGTRNRFRYCDSPPPKYGAKFCEGSSVETERCGNSDWDCEFYQRYPPAASGGDFPANRPEIIAEVGPGCRCGCVVHLGAAKPRRLLATSSQSCPGRIFWQIEADREHIIKFSVEHFKFPCGSQWLKVRDGDSRSSTLIGELSRSHTTASPVISSGPKLLIEFFSDELLAGGQECWGGFLAHAQQSEIPFSNATSITSGFSITSILRNMEVAPTASTSLFLIHCFVVLFVCFIIIVSGCLGIQYILRYRKYQLAAAAEDAESTADSQSSLIAVRSRTTSNSTLLSEVISLQRFKSSKKYKHSRLQEEDPEMDEEQLSESSESQRDENSKTPTASTKTLKPDTVDSATSTPVHSRKSPDSAVSSDTQTTQEFSKRTERNISSSETLENYSTSKLSDSKSGAHKPLQRRHESLTSFSDNSGSTLTNDWHSPSSSIKSAGTRNPKAKKDKKNLEKLLAGSEFSLPEDGDLELDYYDYNVHNASAVPESYIGMDPAYLIWIPPFSPVEWSEESNEKDEKSDEGQSESHICCDEQSKEDAGTKWRENSKLERIQNKDELVVKSCDRGRQNEISKEDSGQYLLVKNPADRGLHEALGEKETRVEKSPSEGSDYYRVIVDIKFADEEDDQNEIDN